MIKALLSMGLSMVVLDIVWIQAWMGGLYSRHIGHLLRIQQGGITVEPIAAGLVYLIMLFGLYWLAVRPSESLEQAVISGAVAGLFSYGTFALTNHAILKDWTWTLALTDLFWGTLLMGVVAGIGFTIGR